MNRHLADYYLRKFAEAVELGDEAMAEEMNRKYTKLTRKHEANCLAWMMFGVLVVTILYPIIHWWLIGWRL